MPSHLALGIFLPQQLSFPAILFLHPYVYSVMTEIDHLSLVFCGAAFLPKGADGRNVRFEALFLGRVGSWGQLDQRVQRNFHPGGFLLRNVHVIRVYATQHRLMRDDENVFAPLKLHDNRLQPDDNIAVTLPATISVVVLVVVARLEVLGISIGDLLIRQAITHPRIQFIQSLPLEFVESLGRRGQKAGRLNGALQRRRPDGEMLLVIDAFGHQVR